MSTANATSQTNSVYQIDFSTSSKGKRLSLTKRRVNFRFGFPNAEAIANGGQGVDCRGEEHEVTLAWSLTSGKRIVKFDNKEVHFSMGKRTEMKFECSFPIKSDHTIKLIAHVAPAIMSPTDEFRQFEIFLDGLSYFDMPRIFELGCTRQAIVGNGSNVNGQMKYGSPSNVPVSNTFVQDNIYQHSMVDTSFGKRILAHPEILPNKTVKSEVRSHEAAYVYEQTSTAPNHFDFSSPSFVQTPTSMSPPSLTNTVSFMNNVPSDKFAPVSPPAPTFQDMSNQIMNAYEQPPSDPGILAIENGPHTGSGYSPMNEPQMSSVQPQYAQHPPPTHINTTPSFSLTPRRDSAVSSIATPEYTEKTRAPRVSPVSSIATPEYTEKISMHSLQGQSQESPQSVRLLDGVEQAMQNLVNFEHMCEPTESPMKLTMMKDKEIRRHSNKSQGLPPVQVAWNLGSQASLADIKANTVPQEAPTKDVMCTNAFNPAPSQDGMMVVHGAIVANQAPPLQNSFGYNAYGGAY